MNIILQAGRPRTLAPSTLKLPAIGLALFGILCGLLPGVGHAASEADLDTARSLVRQGELGGALSHLDRLLAVEPKDPQLRFLMGVALAEDGQVDAAIAMFQALTVDFPKLPEPHNNLAVLHASKGDYENARDALLEAINTHPSYTTAHENLGDIYAKMARIAYDRALSLNNGSATAQAKLDLLRELFSVRDATSGAPATMVAAAKPAAAVRQEPKPLKPATGTQPRSGSVTVAGGKSPAPATMGNAEIVEMIQNWASAWSRQDVDDYLSFYDARFRPANGLSRSQWAANRAVRVRRPRSIEVNVDNFSVERKGADRVAVTFVQTYKSNSFRDKVTKRMELIQRGNSLRILSERSVK